MKLTPPLLTVGPLSGAIFCVTYGRVDPHPTIAGETMVTASTKYDVTDQFDALMASTLEGIIRVANEDGDRNVAEAAALVREVTGKAR